MFLHLCLFPPLSTFLSSSCLVCPSHFLSFLTSSPLSLLCTLPLSSPPCLSLLPLFRLCKVQLGFGAFGLQAWRQEDALSEYALLGSLCVTLYFFALSLFTRRPYLLFLLFFPLLLYLSSHGRPVFLRVSSFDGGQPSASDNTSVLQKTGSLQQRQLFRH